MILFADQNDFDVAVPMEQAIKVSCRLQSAEPSPDHDNAFHVEIKSSTGARSG